MEKYFETSVTFSNLLFKGLDINTTAELVGACIIMFLVSVVCEALKLLKLYLELRLHENPLAKVQNPDSEQMADSINTNSHDGVVLLSSLRFPVNIRQIKARRMTFHILSTLNYVFSLLWAYMVMLVVMKYSAWLTISVLAGCGAGYFILGAFRQKLRNQYSRQQTPSSPSASNEEPQSHHTQETVAT